MMLAMPVTDEPSLRPRSRWLSHALALGIALLSGMLLACPLTLTRGVSCGDGWWDPDYEPCDPSGPNSPHFEACRALGFEIDGFCDPITCELVATEDSCNVCGDGVAAGSEPCDGLDLREQRCMGDTGILRCTDACTLDYDGCPAICGDGIISDGEECDPSLQCTTDNDCIDGTVCYDLTGECITLGEDFAPQLACFAYATEALGINKPYASGTISRCTGVCLYGRNGCGFCGDGELDGAYDDLVYPGGEHSNFQAEFCDGDDIDEADLETYCEPLCIDEPINSDVVVLCDFQCSPDCSDIVPVVIPDPSPESLGCCVASDSPCPKFEDVEGIPDLPCCSWLDNPTWLEQEKCVVAETDALPISYVCP